MLLQTPEVYLDSYRPGLLQTKIISTGVATFRLQIKIRAQWSLTFIHINSFQQD